MIDFTLIILNCLLLGLNKLFEKWSQLTVSKKIENPLEAIKPNGVNTHRGICGELIKRDEQKSANNPRGPKSKFSE